MTRALVYSGIGVGKNYGIVSISYRQPFVGEP